VITYVNPAVALVLGVIVLDEVVTVATIVGFGLILAGCVLATAREPEPSAEPEPVREEGDAACLANPMAEP
jgi:drug/metabolite transporter (DMT)-like permease